MTLTNNGRIIKRSVRQLLTQMKNIMNIQERKKAIENLGDILLSNPVIYGFKTGKGNNQIIVEFTEFVQYGYNQLTSIQIANKSKIKAFCNLIKKLQQLFEINNQFQFEKRQLDYVNSLIN